MEAGTVRNVEISLPAVAIGGIAEEIQKLPSNRIYRFEGFIAARSLKSQDPLFHITGLSLIE